ncbi:DUF4123 domain-containing protein [Polyangium sp. y55x31]|uniref:DUF4123 domain-containing protein n=1 Tax=Polyangium sp. y55x31 TaxID=3042688 RepID=UPI002482E0DB|nr:DUF4123 domain-containing protein [Polyangium sp. y55x31]MDI1482686.1 DUF4123 domain-containing protein [Polyangium sp. y55x31]
MRVIVEVQWGRLASQRAAITPGGSLRVGRTEVSDFVVSHDRRMSGRHFEVSWDGACCLVRDLGSDTGTWLDGRAVAEGEARNASWIRAGDTVFMVFFEGATSRPRPADSPEVAARKEQALSVLRSEKTPLFALLDAARDLRIRELLRESVDDSRSLYEGTQGDALADVAPYLVRLSGESALRENLVAEGWGRSWGVYLTSARPLADVRRHLRRLTMVEAEGETKRLYFRFQDPRVLRRFLAMSHTRQRAEMFGSMIEAFLMEGEQGEVIRASRPSAT